MKQLYIHGDQSYIILRQKPIHCFTKTMQDIHPNMEHVQIYMKWLGADHVLRTQTHFLFCETIPDIDFEIIE
jgi:hypothetical protein